MSDIERLERRVCMSASVVDGSLIIEGTAGADAIRVSRRGADLVVRGAGTETPIVSFPAAGVTQVIVDAGDGNDRVRLERLSIPAVVDAGAGDDRVFGTDADDSLLGGDGNDRLFGRAGNDELDGGAGNDTLLGDVGDDDLTGGAGADRVLAGLGFDSVDDPDRSDLITGVEDPSGLPLGFPFSTGLASGTIVPVSGLPTFNATAPGFTPFPADPVFPGYSSPSFTSNRITFGDTGLQPPLVGDDTFDPTLSPIAGTNFVFFQSGAGLFITAGNRDVLLQRDAGLNSGAPIAFAPADRSI